MVNTANIGSEKREGDPKHQIVILVDGRPMRQFYTSIFLQRLEYNVITAKTAEDALLFLKLTEPLIIIANIDLPEMSGVELLQRVKKDRRTGAIPFLIYTSNNDPHVRKTCEEAGCAAYLSHPTSLEQLYVEVQKATETRPRRFVRLTTFLEVVVGDSPPPDDGPARNDRITMLSERGMFVSTDDPLAFGTEQWCAFSLPNGPGRMIRVEGKVVHRQLGKEGSARTGMGMKFLKVGIQERELIKDFIRAKLMEGLAPE